MRKLSFLLIMSVFAVVSVDLFAAESQTIKIEKKQEITRKDPFTFNVEVKGTTDGSMYADAPGVFFPWRQKFFTNRSLSIENTGTNTVQDPWITVKGDVDLFSIETMIETIIPKGADELTKARLIYEFNRKRFFHEYLGNKDNGDPVKMFNCYGYGICGNNSVAFTPFYQAAGLKTRKGRPWGHSTMEVMIDGEFRQLDGDLLIIALESNNQKIAGEEDFVRDPYLLKRTHSYGLKSWGWAEFRDIALSGFYWHRGKREQNHSFPKTPHTMAMALRPQEKITWLWEQRLKALGAFNDDGKRDRDNKHFHGLWEYQLDAKSAKQYSKDGGLIVPFKLPYPIAGITVALPENYPANGVELSSNGKSFKPVKTAEITKGVKGAAFLKAMGLQKRKPPAYKLWVKLNKPITQPTKLVLDFQAAPRGLPELHLGKNVLAYRDNSKQRNVEVNVSWVVKDDNHRPAAPTAVSPKNGAKVKGSMVDFKWQSAKDPDGDKIVDYQFQLSEYPDLRWPLSSNFDAMLAYTKFRGKTEFSTPHYGLLNPGTKYYWRVRARDAKECWGKWSAPLSFSVEAPGIPVVKKLEVNQEQREILLSWEISGGTTKASKYRLFGSKDRGFTPSMTPYKMMIQFKGGKEKFQQVPGNFLIDTAKKQLVIKFSDTKHLFPFYRLQAVDAKGVAGCWSSQIEIKGPVLISPNTINVPKNAKIIPLEFISSSGHLTNNTGHGVKLSITHASGWRTRVIKASGGKEISGGNELQLSNPLKVGEKVSCEIEVKGSSYFNFEQKKRFKLTLVGSNDMDPEKSVAQKDSDQKLPALPGKILLASDLNKPLAGVKKTWKIENGSFHPLIKDIDGVQMLCFDQPKAYSWGKISSPLKTAAKGDLAVDFSLVFGSTETNGYFQIQLIQNNNQYIYLQIKPFSVITVIQRSAKGTKRVNSKRNDFNFPYGQPVPFRWIVKKDGSQQLFQGTEMLQSWKSVSGPIADGFTELRMFARLIDGTGFVGFGDIKVVGTD